MQKSQMKVSFDPAVKRAIEKHARETGVSVSTWLRAAAMKELKAQGVPIDFDPKVG